MVLEQFVPQFLHLCSRDGYSTQTHKAVGSISRYDECKVARTVLGLQQASNKYKFYWHR